MHVRVDDKKLSKALSGKAKTMKITPQDQDDMSKPLVKLQFKDAKKGGALGRKLSRGKSSAVKMSELDDILDAHTGSGLFDKVKDFGKSLASNPALKNIAKQAVNKVVDVGANKLGALIDSKTGNTGLGKSLTGALGDASANAINQQIGSGLEYTALGGQPPNQFNDVRQRMAYVRSHRKGSGLFDSLKKGATAIASNSAVKNLAKQAVAKGAQMASDKLASAIQAKTGFDASGITNALATAGTQAANQQIGSGMSNKERMAWVRSHKKGKKGGSFKSFQGGSFSILS